jgi:hypothetical protein
MNIEFKINNMVSSDNLDLSTLESFLKLSTEVKHQQFTNLLNTATITAVWTFFYSFYYGGQLQQEFLTNLFDSSLFAITSFFTLGMTLGCLVNYLDSKFHIVPKFKRQYIQHLKFHEQILNIIKTPKFQNDTLLEIDTVINKLFQILNNNTTITTEYNYIIHELIGEAINHNKTFKETFTTEKYDNIINTVINWKKFVLILDTKLDNIILNKAEAP